VGSSRGAKRLLRKKIIPSPLTGEGQGEGELETLNHKGSIRGAKPLLEHHHSLPLEGEGQGEGETLIIMKRG
jgi:hypothetical protein